jgi:uncharacterized membrane protein
MKTVYAALILFILLLVALVTGFLVYPQLPEIVATHWNAFGTADGYSSRLFSILFLPLFAFGLSLLVLVFPVIDPFRKNIAQFRGVYNSLPVGLMVFMLYVHAASLAYNLGWLAQINQAILPGLGVLFIFLGVLLPKARRNWLFGIRTPWTLSSDTVWTATHRLGGALFILAGIFALAGVFFPNLALLLLLVPTMVVSLVTIVYSLILFQREQSQTPRE